MLRSSRRFLISRQIAEVAVSLNTNEVQILSRSGNDWTQTETLSEVEILRRFISYNTSAPHLPQLVP